MRRSHGERSFSLFVLDRKEFLKLIKRNQTVVLVGETGSGKTTQLPQFLLEASCGTMIHMLYILVMLVSLFSYQAGYHMAGDKPKGILAKLGSSQMQLLQWHLKNPQLCSTSTHLPLGKPAVSPFPQRYGVSNSNFHPRL